MIYLAAILIILGIIKLYSIFGFDFDNMLTILTTKQNQLIKSIIVFDGIVSVIIGFFVMIYGH